MNYTQSVIEWAQQQLVEFGRLGATKILKVPDLAAVIPAVAGTISSAPVLTFTEPGTVIAFYGQERLGTTASFARTEVQILMGGSESLVTNGRAADFAPLLGLVGAAVNWFPMLRRVAKGISWSVNWRNMSGASTCDPTGMFAFVADADLDAIAADMQRRQAAKG